MNLPVEILQTIFLELCQRRTLFPLRVDEPRLLVTRICSQWRVIALSMPDLWADLSITSLAFSPRLQHDPIHVWISRSAQSPLSFAFPYDANSSVFPVIINLVAPVVHRCSSLKLYIDAATFSWLLNLPPGSLCSLQTMAICLLNPSTEIEYPIPPTTALESCPQLCTLVLGTSRPRTLPLNLTALHVPWHQLTTLHISSSTAPHECLDVLRQCTSLQECRISISPINKFVSYRIVELYHHRPVTLPSLHTLHVDFSDSVDHNSCFLQALHLPRLRTFLPGVPAWRFAGSTPWPMPVLQSILCDTIQGLDLSAFLSLQGLPETLGLVPNLSTLWLGDNCGMYPDVMRALGEGTIALRLTTLHFGVVNSQVLTDVLNARVAAARADRDIAAFTDVSAQSVIGGPLKGACLMMWRETGMRFRSGVYRIRAEAMTNPLHNRL